MNIPESAIRPFEPLGIPSIGIRKYASITEALQEAFETMNAFGKMDDDKPIGVDTIELFLRSCLGGVDASLGVINFAGWSGGHMCVVDFNYKIQSTGETRYYAGLVRSKAGFKKTTRKLG